MTLRKLDAAEVLILDRLALKWVDDDNSPEWGWALRGVIDRLEAVKSPYDVSNTLYREEYKAGRADDEAAKAVLLYVDGETDVYHLFHFDIGQLVDAVEEAREDRDARDTWGKNELRQTD